MDNPTYLEESSEIIPEKWDVKAKRLSLILSDKIQFKNIDIPLNTLRVELSGEWITNETRTKLPLAIRMAVNAHGDTIGKDGVPYILHPLRMMMQATSYEERVVAILHDTLEDTTLTLYDLEKHGFGSDILDAMDAITKRKSEDYWDYIARVMLNPLATKVKLLDLHDNLNRTRLLISFPDEIAYRWAKYGKAMYLLLQSQNPTWSAGQINRYINATDEPPSSS